MPNRSSKKKKKPTDINQLARFIVDVATSAEEVAEDGETKKDPLAVELGRRGGRKGGRARAQGMTDEERSEAARKAARARWKNEGPPRSDNSD